MMVFPHQTMATVRWCVAAIILESHWNAKTASVSENHGTPSGCSWTNPTHNLTISSSLKDLGHNGVPLPQVAISMQIWFPLSGSSPRVRSISTEAVTMDAMDMLMREGDQMGQFLQGWKGAWDVRLRKILWFTLVLLFSKILPQS